MTKKIYIRDWLLLKPYDEQTVTDRFYLKICNDVKEAITGNNYSFVFLMYMNEEGINQLACFLTSYFEDLISGTNIWYSFVRIHKRLYKKQLPFFDVDEYYEEEINIQDISFLIWYFLNTIQKEKFIAPLNDFISDTAENVYDVFDDAWDHAPENNYLKALYHIDAKENDFYVARKLIDTILFQSYLFFTDTYLEMLEKEAGILKENKKDEHLPAFLNENRDSMLHKSHTRLLAMTGKEWASEILGNENPLSLDYLNMSKKISGFFLYKGQDHSVIFLEHIATGKSFKLTKKSFENSDELKQIDTILFIGLVEWKKEWWFSGVHFQRSFDADLVLDERNSAESRKMVDFLDYQRKEIKELLDKQYEVFLDINAGLQIAFMPSEKVEEFIRTFYDSYNKSLHLTKKEIRDSQKRMRKEGFFGTEKTLDDPSGKESPESALVFFNPKSGCEIAFDVNSAFPLPNNPYFEEKSSEEHINRLLMDESISPELAMFCINNCSSELPYFNQGLNKWILADIDFLLRFWKKDNYHTIPSVTLVGKDKK